MLEDLYLHRNSFLIGLAVGWLLYWLFLQVRPTLKTSRQALSQQFDSLKRGLSISTEHRYRQDLLRLFPGNHIAAPLFSITEIALEPRLMRPPAPVIPDGPIPLENVSEMVIPYMPDFPEMAAAYHSDTFSLPEALSGGANLALISKPGMGKSFALCLLALQVARRDKAVGELKNLVPFYMHAAEMSLPAKPNKLLDVIYQVYNEKVSTMVEAQFPRFLSHLFEAKLALVLLDGLDELPPAAQSPVIDYLETLQQTYPGNRYVVAAATDDISCIDRLNLYPIAMAAWDSTQASAFVQRWSELWAQHIPGEFWSKSLPRPMDPMLLNNWLLLESGPYSPLQFTLKVWAAYAGDTLGPSAANQIEAYFLRMTQGVNNSRPAMEQLAMQMVLSLSPAIERNIAGRFVAEFEEESDSSIPDIGSSSASGTSDVKAGSDSSVFNDNELESLLDELDELGEIPQKQQPETSAERELLKSRQVRQLLPEMVRSNILRFHPNQTISFIHPEIAGFLAGCALAARGGAHQLLEQPAWSGRSMAWCYLAAKGDVSSLVPKLIHEDENDPVRNAACTISSWARYAPINAPWRGSLLRPVAGMLTDTSLAIGLRARLLTALACSGEKGIAALFRQLLQGQHPVEQMLGALGAGMVRDAKAINLLSDMLFQPNMMIYQSACLALVAINTNQALEAVATALLRGDEGLRRAAAEALAANPKEGTPILQEGATMEDLMVRRAVVFGLTRIKQRWAIELLEHMQIEDSQWVVRNAASQALEEINNIQIRIPTPLRAVHEIPWLIAFAAEQGSGISAGQSGWDMLSTALAQGNEDQRLAAMQIYQRKPDEARVVIPLLAQMSAGPDNDLREAAFNTLWHLDAAGVDLLSYLG